MYPAQDTAVVSRGLSRLTGAFVNQPNIKAWLAVLLQPFQDIENAIFGVLAARILATAAVYALPQTNAALDTLGAIVGQPRNGLQDSDYKSAIYLRIAVDDSCGRAIDFSTFAAILVQRTGAGPVQYFEGGAEVYLGVWNMSLNPNLVASMIAQGAGSGVGGTFAYSTWPDGNDLECGSVYAPSAGQSGLSSVYSPTTGGWLVAGAQI